MSGSDLLFAFTPKPRRVTATGPSGDGEVVEFGNFRALRLTLKVVGFEDPSDPVLQIAMETGMRRDRHFVPLGRFLPVTGDGEITRRDFDGVIRFVRWSVVQLEGASAVTFVIQGEAIA